MRKIVIGITGVVVLLLAGSFAWNAEATALTGTIGVQSGPNYSLVEKVQTCSPPKMLLNISGTWYCVSACKPPKVVKNYNGTWYCVNP
jgi:hypothetical protein